MECGFAKRAGISHALRQIAACLLTTSFETFSKKGRIIFADILSAAWLRVELATRLIDTEVIASTWSLCWMRLNPALLSSLSRSKSRCSSCKTYLLDRFNGYMVWLARGDIKAFVRRGFAFVVSRAGSFFIPGIKAGFRLVNKPLPLRVRATRPGLLEGVALLHSGSARFGEAWFVFRAEKLWAGI